VASALLYTQTPILLPLPPALIAPHKQQLAATQESLSL
jgi:hypothetical protein